MSNEPRPYFEMNDEFLRYKIYLKRRKAVGIEVSNYYNIVYLARTPEEKHEDSEPQSDSNDENEPVLKNIQNRNVLNISESLVADHAKHVTRMLPGGMFVIGIFVVNSEDVFGNKQLLGKLKSILSHVNRTLSSNKCMFGVPPVNDNLILHYFFDKEKATCKSVDVTNPASSTLKNIEVNFQSNMNNWQQLDCYYECDEIYPVTMKKTGVSVKEQFQQILDSVHRSIESSIVFFDGKLKVGSDALESLHKKKRVKSTGKQSEDESPQPIQVSIFLPCGSDMPEVVEYLECEGTTHFSGIVASRIYLNPKSTVDHAITAVKQDIIRSLASRFTMHCDALIHDNLLPEEKVCFNEPPRRVLIRLPDLDGNIFLCDYLFPGESPIEALTSVKEMLDANITEDDVISNIETPADTSEFDALENSPINEESSTTPRDANKSIYVGIALAFLVILIAILMQFYM